MGVTANTYSVVGDCQSKPDVFLGIYATNRYFLGKADQDLQETINTFHDSFQHDSAAVRDGLSAPSALDPLWADTNRCKSSESPLACELRLYKPMIVFVNLGTNWKAGASADVYEAYLRKIVDMIIASGALPILTNKADNVEGDHSLNLATAKVAYDYDIPLMNFWLAADSLPNHGLDPTRDNIYLTPEGWDVRNYTALRTLDSVWRALKAVDALRNPVDGKFLRNVILKGLVLFLLFDLVLAGVNPAGLGKISLYNRLFPGRLRFPFGENPAQSYNLSLFNLDAMFASHVIANGAKPASEYRVLVIGDSSTWGTLLRPEQTLAGQLGCGRLDSLREERAGLQPGIPDHLADQGSDGAGLCHALPAGPDHLARDPGSFPARQAVDLSDRCQ